MSEETKLVVSLEAKLAEFYKAMSRASVETNRTQKSVEASIAKIKKAMNAKMEFGGLTNALKGLGLAVSAQEILNLSDAWTNAGNRLLAVGVPADQLATKMAELNRLATESRTEFGTVADAYARITQATQNLGVSQAQVTKVTETIAKAMQLSGASTAEASSAILQLGQALGSGVLQGDELRSLIENSPLLAQAIADEFGVTIGELKKLGAEGKLVSGRVFAAIEKANGNISKSFDKLTPTIAGAFTEIKNGLLEFVGTSAQSSGAAAAIASGLQFIARNAGEAASVLVALGAGWAAFATGVTISGALGSITTLIAATQAFVTSAAAGAAANGVLATSMGIVGTAGAAAATGIRAMTTALLTSPIGVFVLAASAAGLAIYALQGRATDAEIALENYNAAAEASAKASGLFEEASAAAQKTLGQEVKSVDALIGKVDALTAAKLRSLQTEARAAAAAKAAAEVQLGVLGEIADARAASDLAEKGQLRKSVPYQVAGGRGPVTITPTEEQAAIARIAAIEAKARVWAETMQSIGVPAELGNQIEAAQAKILSLLGSGQFQAAVDEATKIGAAIAGNVNLDPAVQEKLLAQIANLRQIVADQAASEGAAIVITGEVEVDTTAAQAALVALEADAQKAKTSLADVMDGVSQEEIDNAPADFLKQITEAGIETQAQLDLTRQSIVDALGADADPAAIAAIDTLIGRMAAGELTALEFDAGLKAIGDQFSVTNVIEGLSGLWARLVDLLNIKDKLTEGAVAIETATPTPTTPTSGTKKQTPFDDSVEKLRTQTQETKNLTYAQVQLNPLVEVYETNLEALRIQQELLSDAQKQGLEITPAVAESIRTLAFESANAEAQARFLTESQDRLRRSADELKSTSRDAGKGLISDLIRGKSAADALAGALQKVSDKLIDVALNAVFDSKTSTGQNLLGSLISSFFGGGNVPQAARAGFAEGGYTGNGGKYEIAGAVHKGEWVVPQEAVKRIGLKNLARLTYGRGTDPMENLPGYSNGGLVGGKSAALMARVQSLPSYATGGYVGGRAPMATPNVPTARTVAPAAAQGDQIVNIINQSGARVTQTDRTDGYTKIKDIVISEVKSQFASGKMDKTLSSRFGIKPNLVGR